MSNGGRCRTFRETRMRFASAVGPDGTGFARNWGREAERRFRRPLVGRGLGPEFGPSQRAEGSLHRFLLTD